LLPPVAVALAPATRRRRSSAGYGWRFFRDTARSRTRRTLLPLFGMACGALRLLGLPPSLALPYFNLVLRKSGDPALP